MRYVFTYASTDGPVARFFAELADLIAYASGWQSHSGCVLLVDYEPGEGCTVRAD